MNLNATVSFLAPVQDDITAIEALMRSQAEGHNADLQAAFNLLLSAGGKRIRPAVTMLAGRMLGGDHARLIKLSAAIEMLHTATLVHDDLIDGSLLRRGMPTLNSRWSPGATVLTGDFVFARAANLAAETESIAVMQLFARTLTVIVEGEINQLFSSRCKADRPAYLKRIYSKTASLFETAAQSAALLSPSAGQKVIDAMRLYGYHIGMAFQIVDDILDFTSDTNALGKPVGSDLRSGIVTLPAILYAESHPADPCAQDLLAGNCIQDFERQEELIRAVRASDAIPHSHREAERYITIALENLRRTPASPERDTLEDLANYIVRREF
jgi:geranylgeranyl pyrophosphate synthase